MSLSSFSIFFELVFLTLLPFVSFSTVFMMKIFTLKRKQIKTRNYTFELQKRKNNTSSENAENSESTSLKLQSILILFSCSIVAWQQEWSERERRRRRRKAVLNAFYGFIRCSVFACLPACLCQGSPASFEHDNMHKNHLWVAFGELCRTCCKLRALIFITASLVNVTQTISHCKSGLHLNSGRSPTDINSRTAFSAHCVNACLKMQSKLMKTCKSQMVFFHLERIQSQTIYH